MADVDPASPVHDRAQPFPPGHTLSMQSGSRSPRTVGPLAEEIERDARADPSWPSWLSDSSYAPAVAAWAHAEARCVLLRRYVADRDLVEIMSDTGEDTSTDTVTHRKGGSRSQRVSSSRRTMSALTALTREEATAARARARLGLDPASRARLGRDMSTTVTVDLAALLSDARERATTAAPALEPSEDGP